MTWASGITAEHGEDHPGARRAGAPVARADRALSAPDAEWHAVRMEPFVLSNEHVHLAMPTAADVDRITELCQAYGEDRMISPPGAHRPSITESSCRGCATASIMLSAMTRSKTSGNSGGSSTSAQITVRSVVCLPGMVALE